MFAADGVGTSLNVLNGKDVSSAGGDAPTNAQEFQNAVAAFEEEKQSFEKAAENLESAQAKAVEDGKESVFVQIVDILAKEETAVTPALLRRERPASNGTTGKTEFSARNGDTLKSIAAEYGQSIKDLLLANPSLSVDSDLSAGQTISVYSSNRLAIAKEIANATDPAKLKDLVRAEILLATSESSTPADLLPALKVELLARRGEGDGQFASIFEDSASWAVDLWARQGRTHEVMDRLQNLTNQGDSQALNQELFNILRDTAISSPTSQAVNDKVETLRRYGPISGFFANALNWVSNFFNFGQVKEAADNISYTYAIEGPEASAALLASYTNPSNFDPLTSARLLDAAKGTISQIITHLGVSDYNLWLGEGVGTPRYYSTNLAKKEGIFGDLAEAVENASQSSESARSVERIASEVNFQMYTYVASAIMNERGATLPVEMMLLLQSIELDVAVSLGLHGLGSRYANIASVVTSNGNLSNEVDSDDEREQEDTLDARLDEILDNIVFGSKN